AKVTLVAPEAHVALGLLSEQGVIQAIDGPPLDVRLRPYEAGEAAAYRLVVTATGRPEVDGAVHLDAERAGVWVNSADDPAHCSFQLPAVWRAGPVAVAVSTGGASPALASWLRDRVAGTLGPWVGVLAGLLADARHELQAAGRSTEELDWASLFAGPLPGLVAEGRLEEARTALAEALSRPGAGPRADGGDTEGRRRR
ncbi:MAG: bifunctional precorrin-2 dehydrogenase/sirohydrochlorin ferrochelatase, partial [Acidobacteriota bacterium]|nr:bifunctional precorrin-2 dehydrogenase/sirohydrochlorin ferrochelatase [Acidobacteriota bacterium]